VVLLFGAIALRRRGASRNRSPGSQKQRSKLRSTSNRGAIRNAEIQNIVSRIVV
jgi:hypothetical protein